MKKVESQQGAHQQLLSMSYLTLTSVALSIVLVIAMHFLQARRGTVEIGQLRSEMTEIKHKMADRSDLQEVRRSLLRLETDVRKISNDLQDNR